MPRYYTILIAASAALLISACKVETSTEKIPNAEGNGKNAVNIRVAPMSRDEIKDATGKVIDKTADVAAELKDAGTSISTNVRDLSHNANTATNRVLPKNTPSTEPSATVIATPAVAVTQTETVTTTSTMPAQ